MLIHPVRPGVAIRSLRRSRFLAAAVVSLGLASGRDRRFTVLDAVRFRALPSERTGSS
jgi:hypothetical protein